MVYLLNNIHNLDDAHNKYFVQTFTRGFSRSSSRIQSSLFKVLGDVVLDLSTLTNQTIKLGSGLRREERGEMEKEEHSMVDVKDDDWGNFRDDDIMNQHSAIRAEQTHNFPFVADKEPLSALSAEYQSGSPILLEKIKLLGEQFSAIRRTQGDGNCFFRSFMLSYLERILETQDRAEIDRVKVNVEECKKTLQRLGYADFTFEDFFTLFLEQLDSVIQVTGASISHDELVERSRDQSISDYVVMFFRFVTSGEIRKRSAFFEPFILGLANTTVDQFCKTSVEPMGEESDHVHIIALSDALGVPIRIVYLDRSSCDAGGVNVNHHDFVPISLMNAADDGGCEIKPYVTLLYRPGHYDILYPKQ